MANTKAVSSKPSGALSNPFQASPYVKYRPLYYIAAFLIPALLTFIAYALFGVYPFNGRSVLTLDLNGQYVYYFEAIRDAFWGGRSALYSWERNLSGGFQSVIGYYLASPFTLIVVLLPKKFILESLMIMQICKVGAAGTSFCVYAQKSKKVPPLQSVIFSTMYALMAFVAIQLIDPMWIDGPIFLPLIILGVEYLIDDGRKINYIIPLAIMFIANFYIGFMVAIFVALYFVFYLFFGTDRKFRDSMDYARTFGRMVLATGVALMCSYIMIMPVYNALALGKFDFSEPDYSFKTMFNPLELIPTLLPNQYYSVNVDEGTRMYGRPEIYCGVLSLVLVPLFYMNKNIRRNKKIGYSLILFVMFFSMYIKPINMMWHGGQDPNWLPYRYSFLISFILVAMAAEAFANLRESEISIKHVSEVFAGLAVLVFIFSTVMSTFNYNEEKYKYVAKFPYKTTENYNGQDFTHIWLGTLCFGLILAAVYLAGIYLYSTVKKKKDARIISLFMAALVIFEAGYNTYDTIWKIHKEVYYSDHKTYDVIKDAYKVVDELEEKDSSFYRSEKTFFRTVNDNQAWGLKGISHSSSVMNGRILRFIETLGYSFKTYETRYDGNTPVADSLLGIKYVFDDPAKHTEGNKKSLLSPYYNKIYSTTYTDDSSKQATLDVYENPDALPIGFMADDDITMLSFLGNDNPFNSMNNFLSSMTGNTPSYTGALEPKEYFKRIEIDPSTDVVLNDCWESDYGGQHCYNANAGAGDPTVRIHLTTQSDDALYMFLKSDNAKKSNLWVSTTKNAETGEFEDFSSYGSYYDGYDYSIVNLGKFPKGTEMEVRLTILPTGDGGAYVGSNEYIMVKDFQFYHLDYETFHNDISALKEHPWVLDMNKTKDNYLTGEIDAQEGQIMYTSIPYEPGWTIKVDGKKVDPLYVEADTADGTKRMQNTVAGDLGSIVILDAMIGLRLPAGHHTVTMKYSPPGFNTGIILLLLGIAACVAFYITDRKSNPVMIAERKAKERRKAGLPEVNAADGKKPVQIIKSKGSEVAAKAEAVKDKAAEKAEQAAEAVEKEVRETAEDIAEKVDKTAEAVKETAKDAVKTVKKEVSKPAPKKNNGGKKKKKK